AKTLGIRAPEFHSYPDNRMDSVDLLDIVKNIEAMIDRVVPEIVYTHHASDVNIDHRIVHDAVITAVRPQPQHCVKKLLFFEVPSSTEWRPGKSMATFSPDYFVDISESVEHKLQALSCYEDEMREFPHPRSLEACLHLLKWRGATVGVQAAEAFEVGRIIE
ncbi:MAG: PIG-L family deacetylase, partial [Gammaproteobacteria bacterium]|nr:PIG-L family deacetylase [Gammaproteobacteria bacterium]